MTLFRFVLSTAIVLVTTTVFAQSPSQLEQNPVIENQSKTVEVHMQELHAEKCKLLKKRLDQVAERFDRGEAQLDTLLNAEYDLLSAKLQSCVTKPGRMMPLREMLKNRRRMEEYRATSVEQGTGSEEDLLLARAECLDAQIAIFRELPSHSTVTT